MTHWATLPPNYNFALSPLPVAPVSERLSVLLQYLLPKRALTVYAGWVAGYSWGWYTTRTIRRFIAKYQVNMAEAVNPDPASYKTFNDFFTRAL